MSSSKIRSDQREIKHNQVLFDCLQKAGQPEQAQQATGLQGDSRENTVQYLRWKPGTLIFLLILLSDQTSEISRRFFSLNFTAYT